MLEERLNSIGTSAMSVHVEIPFVFGPEPLRLGYNRIEFYIFYGASSIRLSGTGKVIPIAMKRLRAKRARRKFELELVV